MTEIRRTTRRQFLRQSACAAVGMTALGHTIFDLQRIAAAATARRRLQVPRLRLPLRRQRRQQRPRADAGGDYARLRRGARRPGAAAELAAAAAPARPPPGDARQWGLHPSLTGLQGLFNGGKRGAWSPTSGRCVAPLTRDRVPQPQRRRCRRSSSRTATRPVHWQTSLPDQPARTGWGGRTADLLHSLNENASISMSISLAGTNTFQVGNVVTQYQVSPEGPVGLTSYVPADQGSDPRRTPSAPARQELRQPFRARLQRRSSQPRARQPGAALGSPGRRAGDHHRRSRTPTSARSSR